ncbi:protein-S-isoprenylcysteine O-methyltransferase Ste14 [Aurantimicrobium minutum]|uniref:methyltransferase family protein n=1 Tax=Aurantimicrobium minutum TaxID=708131 RepID=UPI002475F5D9|nr:isoprenylcysteine carboxylmethyltransferase family protein [Aurantimicrobium minutum]MDH6532851.1 protein-S-isoprenylcysteine O-methyltransferase Ste14 [Aurantimicrobium minutum]
MSDKSKGSVLVAAQFVLLALLVELPHGSLWFVSDVVGAVSVAVLMMGLFVALLGIVSLGNSLTATPVPKREAVLRTTGMYTLVRHPIYSGLILIGLSMMILSASVWGIVLCAALIAVLSYKSRFEEKLLLAKYPGYAAYASRVGRLVPFVGRLRI